MALVDLEIWVRNLGVVQGHWEWHISCWRSIEVWPCLLSYPSLRVKAIYWWKIAIIS